MATIYITSNKYLDEVSYSANDAITIQSGAKLTVRKTNAVATGAITISEGEFCIDSSAPGAVSPIVFTGSASGYLLSAGALGKFSTNGSWLSLGTGTGVAGQALTHIHSTAPPFVQVETGAGTGIYEPYLNLASNPFLWVGSGVFGRFFQYTEATSTLTFGNGTNGKIPPMGANIRIPDIFITSGAAYNATYSSRPSYYNSGASNLDLSICSFSDRIYFNSSALCNIALYREVGGFGYFRIGGPAQSIAINGLYVAMDRAVSQVSLILSGVSGSFENIYTASRNTYSLGSGGFSNIEITGGAVYALNRSSSSYAYYIIDALNYLKLNNFLLAGKFRISGANLLEIVNCHVSDSCDGVVDTTLNMNQFQIANVGNMVLDGVTIPSGGTCCRSAFIGTLAIGSASIKNVDLSGHDNYAYFIDGSTTAKLIVSKCKIGNPRVYPWYFAATVSNCSISNVYAEDVGTGESRLWGSNIKLNLGVNYPTCNAYGTGSMDICAFLACDAGVAPATGRVQFLFFPEYQQEYLEIVSGTPVVPLSGGLYLRTAGDQIIVTSPDVFYAVTGFQGVAPTLNTTYLQYEYQIKEPADSWGYVWKLVNAANLSAETVSATTGFNMRLRITCLSSNSNAVAHTISIPVNIDSTYIFPTEFSTLIISGMVSGSTVKVTKTSDSSVLYIGSSSTITLEYAGEVRVVIRKGTGSPAYKQFDTIVTLISDSTIEITALQELDE